MASQNAILVSCFRELSKKTEYHNKWISDSAWLDLVKEHYDLPPSILDTTHTAFNVAVSRHPILKSINLLSTRESNALGIYKATFRKRVDGKLTTLTAYYVTLPNALPLQQPGSNVKWYETVVSVHEDRRPNTRAHPALKRNLPGDVATASTTTPSPSKRGRRNESPVAVTPPPQQEAVAPLPQEAPPPILGFSYWESTEAWQLFGTRGPMHNDDLEAIVERKIQSLMKGYTQPEGWKQVLDDFDQQKLCSAYDIFNIQMKCRYLASLACHLGYWPFGDTTN